VWKSKGKKPTPSVGIIDSQSVLQPVLRPVGVKGVVVLPKRWMVERTFSWIGKFRRHSKDYERNPDSSKAMIHIAMTIRMLKLLEKKTKGS
jgi:putative transposase